MSPFEMLIKLDLMCWSTVVVGFGKGWMKRKDIFDYAISQLASGSNSVDVAVIAGGEYLSDGDLLDLILKQVKKTDCASDLDKWRLAFLLCIKSSEDCDESKVNRLQEIYADFDYPEDMASCSVYSQNDISPLVAMDQVVGELRERFSLQ
ncbi:DUF2247 family protein [Pseudomonas sp. NPDC090755]|uniref:DUF2247 family protein n=1 Tax=Pseudomonas sp. NPDC090755 TaxID=3364481 RepID=UPI00383A1F4B